MNHDTYAPGADVKDNSQRGASRRQKASGWKKWVPRLSCAVIASLVVTVVFLDPGYPVSSVDLNDGSVWLTNQSTKSLGRYNRQVEELDGGVVATESDLDVMQDANDILLHQGNTVSVVDSAALASDVPVMLPALSAVTMAAGTVAVTEQAEGKLWIRTMDSLPSLRSASEDPQLTLGTGGASVVAKSGAVLALSTETGEVHRVDLTDEAPKITTPGQFAAGFELPLSVTTVGEKLFGLSNGMLYGSDGSTVDLSAYGNDLTLQQPGADSPFVLVASRVALLRVEPNGKVEVLDAGGSGNPTRPVMLGQCSHAAWAAKTGSYLRVCADAPAEHRDLAEMTQTAQLTFRVNRSVIVLNDTADGRVWMPDQDSDVRKPNWEDIVPEKEQSDSDQSEDTSTQENLQSECTPSSGSVTAKDDSFGVRPGKTRVLPVINNDGSPDCGILAISEFDQIPETFGVVSTAAEGRALQVSTVPEAAGSVSFNYTITDGRGNSVPATALVTLTARSPDENSSPIQFRPASVAVEQGSTVSYNVLNDFADPDGDDLLLASATGDPGITVHAQPNGEISLSADGEELGRKAVALLVQDGFGGEVEGSLTVEVQTPGSKPPLIEPILRTAYIDTPIVVRPLDAVRSISREPVRLAGTDPVAGADIVTDTDAGTFTFSASRPGTYYVPFTVVASPQTAKGLARIDVSEWPEEATPPRTVLDVAYLPPGKEITVDPLANDVDPSGNILVLQTVEVLDPLERHLLKLSVIDHRFVQVESHQTLQHPVALRYIASNGPLAAPGEIHIIPVPPSATQRPPVVANAEAEVRADAVVTIPVLEKAYDPDGDEIHISPTFPEPLAPGEGLLFVSGKNLRYQAPSTPMTVHATFTVQDSAGNLTSAMLTVRVHSADAASKPPPRPRDIIARVFDGDTVRIPIPLIGIDSDGDGVTLLGQDKAPSRGRIIKQGADFLLYEAYPGESGTDAFSYAVEDWTGQRATGKIQVGIAARPESAAYIVARDDTVAVRPGQKIEYRVLRNDIDLSGRELSIDPNLQSDPLLQAKVDGTRIVATAPAAEGEYLVGYTATNVMGSKGSATLTVTVSHQAVFLAPIARDVIVQPADTLEKSSVEVDVLSVAENPSGPLSELSVSVEPSVASVAHVTTRGKITVTLRSNPQTLPFLLTNTNPEANGVSSFAFITVPALGDYPPMERPNARKLRVLTGVPLTISIDEYIRTAPAKIPQITTPESVTATKSDGSALMVNPRTLQFISEPNYIGAASISFEITDAVDRNDPEGNRRSFTLPIQVYSDKDNPPRFDPPIVEVATGESVTMNLASATKDPTGSNQKFTYRLTSEIPAGFTARISGSTLTVATTGAAHTGLTGSLDLAIGYGISGVLPAVINLRVTASTKSLVRVKDFTIPDGLRGQARSVSVLEGAINPFDTAPRVVGATVEAGAGSARHDERLVTVTPDDSFVGQLVVRYSVQDSTGDPERIVEGRIYLQVRAKPDAPKAPRIDATRERTVVLAWEAPPNNSSAIDAYRVTIMPGGEVRDCGHATTCTIDGLANGRQYSFTVAAHNEIDWSDPSPPSAGATPDTVPDAVGTVTLQVGDSRLTASWPQATSTGSNASGYHVEISGEFGGRPNTKTEPSQITSRDFVGLTNGKSYVVRVRALNAIGDAGPWSVAVQATPATKPSPATVTAVPQSSAAGGSIEVSWTPGAPNDVAQLFRLHVYSPPGSTLLHETEPSLATSYTFSSPTNGVRYSFKVVSTNSQGPTDSNIAYAETIGSPSEVTGLSATGTIVGAAVAPGAGSISLTWNPPAQTGDSQPLGEYRLIVKGTASKTLPVSGSARDEVVPGLPAGIYSVTLQACNRNRICNGGTEISSVSIKTRPGPLPAVSLTRESAESHSVILQLGPPPSDNGGSTLRAYETAPYDLSLRTCGQPNTQGPIDNQPQIINAPGPLSICVRVVNGDGLASDWAIPNPVPAPTG